MLIAILIISIITLPLSACSLWGINIPGRFIESDEDVANAKMDKVLAAIKNKDKDSLKLLFSKKAVAESKNLEASVAKLFEFFKGKYISYNDWGGPGVEDTSSGWKRIDSTYDVKTSKGKYRFAIRTMANDPGNEDNIGIYSLYIIKMEDDPYKDYAYWGDGEWTPGINFNKQGPKRD
jgi:hypothetical protein